MKNVNAAIKRLGIDLLRELKAIRWFCDSGPDGKMALIPSDRRALYEPGGDHALLVELGCVKLLRKTHCQTIDRYRPAIRMEQFGRTVLVRATAMRLPLDPPDDERASRLLKERIIVPADDPEGGYVLPRETPATARPPTGGHDGK